MNSHPIQIITLNDGQNYGNRLQNYALTCLLKQYSPDVHTVHALNYIKGNPLLELARPCFTFIQQRKQSALERERVRNFTSFTNRYIGKSNERLTYPQGFHPRLKEPTCFVIGSDQVWNDRFSVRKGELQVRLGGMNPPQSTIAYAASFGVDQVKPENISTYKEYLSKLLAVSVREEQGVVLAKELANVDATVVLDPTLMIPAEQWKSITQNFVEPDDRYILTYFLGEPTQAQQRLIDQVAQEQHCRVRRILDVTDPQTYVAGPQDFVELFSKAQYVFTDSYHACCFSIIFNVPFKVFNRSHTHKSERMNSRMQTLFNLFALDASMDEDTLHSIDYSQVNALLSQHQQQSQAWLTQAMENIQTTCEL